MGGKYMDRAYDRLMDLQRPHHADDSFSRRHPKMARLNRAKLFAPFAALRGFDEAVRSKERPYVPRHILDPEEIYALNRALFVLWKATQTRALARQNRVTARVEVFAVCDDPDHEAFGRLGLYHALTGVVQRVDPAAQILTLDRRAIRFSDISAITDPTGRYFGDRILRGTALRWER